MVLGITGAIRIDADQDGRFTCAYDYAKALWASSGKNIHLFLKKLGDYDESVSIEAAAVLSEHDIDLNAVTLKKELEKAPSIVRIGFKNYGSALKHSNH